jgi:hypothetical protein
MRHNGQEPDDTRQILAERDLLSGMTNILQDIRGDNTNEPYLEGEDALRKLFQAARDREPNLSEREAAKLLNLKLTTLGVLRRAGKGPPVSAVYNGKPFYVAPALREWQRVTGRTVTPVAPRSPIADSRESAGGKWGLGW